MEYAGSTKVSQEQRGLYSHRENVGFEGRDASVNCRCTLPFSKNGLTIWQWFGMELRCLKQLFLGQLRSCGRHSSISKSNPPSVLAGLVLRGKTISCKSCFFFTISFCAHHVGAQFPFFWPDTEAGDLFYWRPFAKPSLVWFDFF